MGKRKSEGDISDQELKASEDTIADTDAEEVTEKSIEAENNDESGNEGKDRKPKKLLYFLLGFFFLLVAVIFLSIRWLFRSWGALSIDELIYHVKASLDGTNPDMIYDYLKKGLLPAVAVTVVAMVGVYVTKRWKVLHRLAVTGSILLIIAMAAKTFSNVDRRLGVIDYVRNYIAAKNGVDFVGDNYVYPENTELTFPDKKRNLVYIFLESMEMTYSDKEHGGDFKENVIPELTTLALDNEDFSGAGDEINGGISLPGSTWTMGAMFGQSSGVPLKIPLTGNGMSDQESFFSGMVTLGDILNDNGYNQELLIGSKATFGGRLLYYQEHGDYTIHDYNYAVDTGLIPNDYYVFWGFEDEKLFEYAKNDITEMAASGEPFNCTILTVDTHFEDGYVCRLCDNEFGDDQYANVMACSSRQVYGFVEWLKQQDFYENTTIVICGDHPTMDKNFCKGVDDSYQRRTFTAIINSAVDRDEDTHRDYSTFDMFPTTLAALGVDIAGNRLGLGTNLYSEEKTLIEEYGVDDLERKLDMPSAFLNSYANVSITEATMNKIVDSAYLSVNDEGDNLEFTLRKANKIDPEYINEVIVEIAGASKDNYNGEYKMSLNRRKGDPNSFTYTLDSTIPSSEHDNITATVYMSVEGFDHYKILEYRKEDKDKEK